MKKISRALNNSLADTISSAWDYKDYQLLNKIFPFRKYLGSFMEGNFSWSNKVRQYLLQDLENKK